MAASLPSQNWTYYQHHNVTASSFLHDVHTNMNKEKGCVHAVFLRVNIKEACIHCLSSSRKETEVTGVNEKTLAVSFNTGYTRTPKIKLDKTLVVHILWKNWIKVADICFLVQMWDESTETLQMSHSKVLVQSQGTWNCLSKDLFLVYFSHNFSIKTAFLITLQVYN